jgi:hypothetical protein
VWNAPFLHTRRNVNTILEFRWGGGERSSEWVGAGPGPLFIIYAALFARFWTPLGMEHDGASNSILRSNTTVFPAFILFTFSKSFSSSYLYFLAT